MKKTNLSLYERLNLIGSIKLRLDSEKLNDAMILSIAYLVSAIDRETYNKLLVKSQTEYKEEV